MFATMLAASIIVLAADPAMAELAAPARAPSTFRDGFLAGLRQPVIALNQLAAAMAVGCLATMHPKGAIFAIVYAVAAVIGAAAHIGERTVEHADVVAALVPVGLGLLVFRKEPLRIDIIVALFAGAGLINGYVMGVVIAAAQREPILGYLAGLAAIESAVALAVMFGVRALASRDAVQLLTIRVVGAFGVGAGAAVLLQRYTV